MATDTQPSLDLDALLAIMRRRTPGELIADGDTVFVGGHPMDIFAQTSDSTNPEADAAAIVTAVNNFEALAERCRRAEAVNEALKAGLVEIQDEYDDLDRQRDELLHMVDQVRRNTDQPHIREACRELHERIHTVEGGADGKA